MKTNFSNKDIGILEEIIDENVDMKMLLDQVREIELEEEDFSDDSMEAA